MFLKISQISLETPVLESLFNKVVGLLTYNFVKKRLQHRCFPVKFEKFLRTPILKNVWNMLFLLQPLAEAYSGPNQTSKMELFDSLNLKCLNEF